MSDLVNLLLIAMFGGTYLVCHSLLAPEHFQKYIHSPTVEQWELFKLETRKN